MFEGQPKGLFALALANTGERFGYYTMLAVFTLFMRANFGMTAAEAGDFYSVFLGQPVDFSKMSKEEKIDILQSNMAAPSLWR